MTAAPIFATVAAIVTLQTIPPKAKAACDIGLIVGGALSTLAGWLPPLAALISIIWGGMNIYYLLKDRRNKRT